MNQTELAAPLAEAEQMFARLRAVHQAVGLRLDSLRSTTDRDEWSISETKEELAQAADRLRAAEISLTTLRIEELRARLPAAVAAIEPKKEASDAAWDLWRAAALESDRLAFEYNNALSEVSGIESGIACFERRIAELQAVADRTDVIEADAFAERLARLEAKSRAA